MVGEIDDRGAVSATAALSSAGLLLQLVQRDEYRGRPSEVEQAVRQGTYPGIDPAELPLVAAAAALNVGDAKRALRTLKAQTFAPGSDAAVVASALVNLANALDRNWFPGGGGAVLEEGDIGRMVGEQPTAASAAPTVQLLVTMTQDVAAMVPLWRNVVENAARSGQPAVASTILGHVDTLRQQISGFGVPAAVAYMLLIQADLLWRAGLFQAVSPPHTAAFQTYQALGDVTGAGACWMLRGDWSATPLSQPELLGLTLDAPLGQATAEVDPDPASARECYAHAQACFETAGAGRGLAAVELRLAYLDDEAGDGASAGAHRERALALARESSDAAGVRLAGVHRAIAALTSDGNVTPTVLFVGSDVAQWAQNDGSYSYARGLARLCLAVGRHLREGGEVLRARPALRVADAINAGVGAVVEPALVSAEYAQVYGGANYRRAMLVLTELDVEARIEAAASPAADPLSWLSLVDTSMQANATAIGLRDPDAIERGAQRLERVLAMAPASSEAAGGSDPVAFTAAAVRETIAQAGVLVLLYRATQARDDGRAEDAEALFDQAQRAADAVGGLMQLVVLATRRRRDEGLELARALVAAGQLPPDFAAELLQRLGAPAEAQNELAKVEAMGTPSPSARPWERLALPAEVHESLGEWDEAVSLAVQGVQEFEQHLARLSRDVLRLSAMDDITVVSLYTTAVRGELGRDGSDSMDVSFRMSDRCRGIALADLFASDRAAGTSAEIVEAVRAWHRAGVRLASLFEQIRWQGAEDPAQVRTRVATAERELDDAEARLDAVAPALMRARREPPPTPSLEEIQSLLRPESLLLQYHFFDDELICWAVTRDGARTVRTPGLTGLVGEARRFLRACADLTSTKDERDALAGRLGGLVLEPFAAELREHARVVLVPHARLGLLPFHLLPFEGNVLCAERSVSYLPASSVATRWAGAATPRLGADTVVVGDPAYARDRGLRPLHGARVEAEAIARLLGAPTLLDDTATAEAVSTRLDQAHAAHLATHGLVPEASPNSAQLALAGDESLTIADLMGLDAELDLAVLSACDTARGTATAGGDVIGLTRALLAAGARDVVVSLWPVDDVAGCLTMVDFYRALLESGDVTRSLAAAQAGVRADSAAERREKFAGLADSEPPEVGAAREWDAAAARRPAQLDPAHPYFWGSFIHIGL